MPPVFPPRELESTPQGQQPCKEAVLMAETSQAEPHSADNCNDLIRIVGMFTDMKGGMEV